MFAKNISTVTTVDPLIVKTRISALTVTDNREPTY